jgi:hypothetical protein
VNPLGIHALVWTQGWSEDECRRAVARFASRLRPHRREPSWLPRDRTVDFDQLFAALAEIGYDGPLTFESFSTAVISERFASALAVWRDPWQDGRDLAAHARRVISDQLRAARNV